MSTENGFSWDEIHSFVDVLQRDLTWDADRHDFDPSIVILKSEGLEIGDVRVHTDPALRFAERQIKTLFGVEATVTAETHFLELLAVVATSCPDWFDKAKAYLDRIRAEGEAENLAEQTDLPRRTRERSGRTHGGA